MGSRVLAVRGLRGHAVSGRGFNLFKPLRRHFRATATPLPCRGLRIPQLSDPQAVLPAMNEPRAGRAPDLLGPRLGGDAVSGRGFNLFELLRRHFPVCGRREGQGRGGGGRSPDDARAWPASQFRAWIERFQRVAAPFAGDSRDTRRTIGAGGAFEARGFQPRDGHFRARIERFQSLAAPFAGGGAMRGLDRTLGRRRSGASFSLVRRPQARSARPRLPDREK